MNLHYVSQIWFESAYKLLFLFLRPWLCLARQRRPAPSPVEQCSTQTSEWEHVNITPRWSAHNAYHSDLNSVTTDNFTNSWGSIKAHLKYATCHFYIRKHAVQNGTFSLVFVIILQAKLVSSRGLKCQMIYSSPLAATSTLQSCGKRVEGRGKIYFKLSLSLRMQSTREG